MKANTPGYGVKKAPVYCGWLSSIALEEALCSTGGERPVSAA